ncbi:MAG TPA: hydrogenase maturation protease [Pyrinomonadaceae bacterium]|nr:hydrogenase maturation protease [Pyrinomonadaceae bacterium]
MMMANKRILVAGIGNIFLGDDAFGCEVVQRLSQRELPPETLVVDFGIRGFDLAYALLEDFELSILVDATPRGGAPGTLYVIEIDFEHLDEVDSNGPWLDAHAMNPMRVLALVKSMGGKPKRLLIVGCEPAPVAEQEDPGLSKPVVSMLDKAVELLESLVKTTINEETMNTARAVVRC